MSETPGQHYGTQTHTFKATSSLVRRIGSVPGHRGGPAYTANELMDNIGNNRYQNAFDSALRDVLCRIEALREREVGWNGYDVTAPEPQAIIHAAGWLKALYRQVEAVGQTWLAPHVSADENGSVAFEWQHGTRWLSVVVSAHAASWVNQDAEAGDEMQDGPADTEKERAALWEWLTA